MSQTNENEHERLVTYVNGVLDQMHAAIRNHDGDGAATAIKRLAKDGYPELASKLADLLVVAGLRHMTGMHEDPPEGA